MPLYTGGFASPTVIGFLSQLHACAPGLRFLHWGDMDAGGLRILRHLRRNLPAEVQACGMDTATFEAHLSHAQPFAQNDPAALDSLKNDAALTPERTLIAALQRAQRKLEQEAIPIAYVLARWF